MKDLLGTAANDRGAEMSEGLVLWEKDREDTFVTLTLNTRRSARSLAPSRRSLR